MFKSLFRLVERVVGLLAGAPETRQSALTDADEETLESQESLVDSVELSEPALNSGELPDKGQLKTTKITIGREQLDIEVEDIEMFADDWGGKIPQRTSTLFPQSRPQQGAAPLASSGVERRPLEEVSGRGTPSAHQLFTEAEATIKPTPPPPRPDRPYPQPHQPHEPEPFVGSSESPRQYRADVQVGRLMKQDPPPPPPPPMGLQSDSRYVERGVTEIHRAPRRSRRRMIQTTGDPNFIPSALTPGGQEWVNTHQPPLPSPPRGAGEALAYHDLQGERGAMSRAQFTHPQVSEISPQSQPLQPIELNNPALHREGLFERLRPSGPPPQLKPKPVRFTKGNYLRFWGNYSAQPNYLHFGSLIRSERFIELLPIWHDELDELEVEARDEWSHLEGDVPFEGEADWRRLLNPTMSSPIDFLLHRDRVEQLTILPRGKNL